MPWRRPARRRRPAVLISPAGQRCGRQFGRIPNTLGLRRTLEAATSRRPDVQTSSHLDLQRWRRILTPRRPARRDVGHLEKPRAILYIRIEVCSSQTRIAAARGTGWFKISTGKLAADPDPVRRARALRRRPFVRRWWWGTAICRIGGTCFASARRRRQNDWACRHD